MDQDTVYSSPDTQGYSPQPLPGSMMINSDFRPLDIDQYYTSSPSLTHTQPSLPTQQLRSRVRGRKMTTSEEGSPHRKRIAVACNRCRKRKIRCSGENPADPSMPCVNCLNAGHSPCLFLRPFSSETAMLEDRHPPRPATSSQASQQRLMSSIVSSPSLIGGIGAINRDLHGSDSMKAEAGYHFGSAIRSTLPQVNNYPSEDGMFPVNPIPNYTNPDSYVLTYRPVQQTSYNQLAVNNLHNQSRLETESMYFGNGGAVSSVQSQRPPALNLGVSYPMSNDAYEPMSGSPDGLWHTRSGSSANSRSSDGSDFQYRYTDTTSYRASASYATPLPSNRAVVMAPAPHSNHPAANIEAPSGHESPHRL